MFGTPADVVVLGQIARDLVLTVAEAPGPGESATVRARRELLGGKGANQAVALSQLGTPTALIGVVGDDPTADALVARVRADGIDATHIARREGAETALIVDVVDDHGKWHYLEHIPEEVLVGEGDVFAASRLITSARAVILQLQQPFPAVLLAARLAASARARVILDGAPQHDGELLAHTDIVRADAREAEQLAGRPIRTVRDAVEAGTELLRHGPSLVVFELSGEGNVFVAAGGHEFVPLVETEVVDTTGAGDALVATLTAALLAGRPAHEAARLAVAAAAATAGHPGGRPNLTPADLVSARLAPPEKEASMPDETANPRRTQVGEGDPTDQDWTEVGEEVREAVENADGPARRKNPESPLEDEEGKSEPGHPGGSENFRGSS